MKNTIKIVNSLSSIEKLYEEVFTKRGMEKFTQLIWINIRNDFDNIPTSSDLFFRVIVEEMFIYAIILKNEKGYNILKQQVESEDKYLILKIKPYKEMEEHYREYIQKVQKFFEENPERKKNLLKD